MSTSPRKVDNFLQEELFESTLLFMPTRTKSVTEPESCSAEESLGQSVQGQEVDLPESKSISATENGNGQPTPKTIPSRPDAHLRSRTQLEPRQASLDLPLDPPVRIIKSKRRKRHIAAYRQSGEIVISVPFRTTRAEISALVPEMVARVIASEERSRVSESELEARAGVLLSTFLPEITVKPASITWRPMSERWGSCTTVDRTIRISDRLRSAPGYVIDCVLFHELIHLTTAGHGEDFHALLARYPDLERAEAFLEGFEAGERGV